MNIILNVSTVTLVFRDATSAIDSATWRKSVMASGRELERLTELILVMAPKCDGRCMTDSSETYGR
jgi:hypothetical protein